MTLAAGTASVVSQFDFTDADLNSHVTEFLKQMGTLRHYSGADGIR